MNIFGQVWLWSLLAFIAGVSLTWLVKVRPAAQRVADLEDQLQDARRSAEPPAPAKSRVDDDFVIDEWEDSPPRSLTDDVLTPPPAPAPTPAPAPYSEPPAYFGEPVPAPAPAPAPLPPVPAPVAEEPAPAETYDRYDDYEEPSAPVRQYLDPEESQRRFEEQLAEQQKAQAQAEDEDDRPRSLFERLAPEGTEVPAETPAEMTNVLPRSGPQSADFDDEPELPAEQTSYVPTVEPVAEVGEPVTKPTAPPEVDEQPDDFVYQPREVWAEEEQETFLDEAAEQEDEPAGTRSEQTTYIPAAQSDWPDNDLTGEYPGLRDEISGQLDGFTEPEEEPAEQTGLIEVVRDEDTDSDGPGAASGDLSGADEPEADEQGVHESTLAEEFTEPEPEHEAVAETESGTAEPEPAEDEREELQGFVEPEPEPEPEVWEPRHAYSQPFITPGTPPPAPFSAFEPRKEVEETQERTPRAVGAAFAAAQAKEETPEPAQKSEQRPRSLFEPLLDADEPLPPLGQTRQLPDTTDEQPFVPKFVPSDEPLLAAPPEPEPAPVVQTDLPQRVTEAGLPIREARRTTQQRQQSFPAFQAFESPKPEAPATPKLPVRPRPVGFSPSTGGRPNGATTTTAPSSARFQQPEGFNPRSPFGPGSVLPKSDGHAPAPDFAVKATLTGRRYYTEGSSHFGDTRADVWFRTEADAEKAGFRPAP